MLRRSRREPSSSPSLCVPCSEGQKRGSLPWGHLGWGGGRYLTIVYENISPPPAGERRERESTRVHCWSILPRACCGCPSGPEPLPDGWAEPVGGSSPGDGGGHVGLPLCPRSLPLPSQTAAPEAAAGAEKGLALPRTLQRRGHMPGTIDRPDATAPSWGRSPGRVSTLATSKPPALGFPLEAKTLQGPTVSCWGPRGAGRAPAEIRGAIWGPAGRAGLGPTSPWGSGMERSVPSPL